MKWISALLLGTSGRLGVAASGDQHLLHRGVDGLLDLVGLLLVGNHQSVKVLAAADLELGQASVLLHLDAASVLAGADGEKLLQVLDLAGHIVWGRNARRILYNQLTKRKDSII